MKTINFFLIFFFQNIPISFPLSCSDENCMLCPSDSSFCSLCYQGFEVYHNKCEKKCSSIKNCYLCDKNETQCIKCSKNCKLSGTGCSCTLRYVLIGICILLGLVLVFFVVYLLTHTSLVRKYSLSPSFYDSYSIRRNQVNSQPIIGDDFINNNNNINNIENGNRNKKSESELLEDFYKFKINDLDRNIENLKCFCCNVNLCNLKLECGCYVCFDCEKKLIKTGLCSNCNKRFNSVQQITCSICFCNKKEISKFNCQCKMNACKECFIKWRLVNETCPVCRTIIV